MKTGKASSPGAPDAGQNQQQARLLDLVHAMVRDLSGRITLWTNGMERLYGWSGEEAIGQVCHSLLKTQFPKPLEQIEEELLRDGRWEGELVHPRRDGGRVVVASHWVLHRDQDGRPTALLEVNNDITLLRRSEQHLQAVIDTTPECIKMVAPDGTILQMN